MNKERMALKNLAKYRYTRLKTGKYSGFQFGKIIKKDPNYIESLRGLKGLRKKFKELDLLVKFYDYSKIYLTFTMEIYERQKAVKETTKVLEYDGDLYRWRQSLNINLPRYVLSGIVAVMQKHNRGYLHRRGKLKPDETMFAQALLAHTKMDETHPNEYDVKRTLQGKPTLYFQIINDVKKYMPQFGKQMADSLEYVWNSPCDLFIINNIQTSPSIKNIPLINPIHQNLKSDSCENIPRMISEFIDYEIGSVVYKNLKNNFLENLCVFTNIINIFSNEYNKGKYRNFCDILTYENLLKLCFGESKFTLQTLQKRGIKIIEVLPFFKQYGISLNVFDVNMKKILEEKNTTDSGIRPSSVNFIIHNNHLFHLNTNLDKIKHFNVNFSDSFLLTKPIPMKLLRERPKDDKNIKILSVSDESTEKFYDSLKEIEDLLINIKHDKNMDIFVNSNLIIPIAMFFYKKTKFEPKVIAVKGNKPTHIQISKKVIIKTIESNNGPFNFCSCTESYVDSVLKIFFETQRRIMKREWMSHYHYDTYEILKSYKPTPISYYFNVQEKTNKFIEWDQRKFYASIVAHHLNHVVKLNQFDKFLMYNGESIKDYNMYFCEKITDSFCFPVAKKYGLYYGINIKDCLDCIKIHYVLPVSCLVSSVGLSESIKDLYNNVNILEEHKKLIGNIAIGMLSSDYKKKSKGFFTDSLEEAKYFCDTSHGKTFIQPISEQIQYEGKDYKNVYLCTSQTETPYKSGFIPIGHFIVETASKMIYNLYNELKEFGFSVYSINTDCVYTNFDEELKNAFIEKYYSKYFSGNQLNFLKSQTVDGFKGSKPYELEKNEKIIINTNKYVQCPIITLDSEKNWKRKPNHFKNDVVKLFDSNDIIFIKGGPGYGKSYCTKLYGKKTLFVVPLTQLRYDLLQSKLISCTFDTFFNTTISRDTSEIQIDDDPSSNIDVFGNKYELENFEVIVFDEVGLLDITKKSRMINFIQRNKGKYKFILSGDFYQCSPIGEDLNYIENKEQHNEDIVMFFCSVCLQLCINKRDSNKGNKSHYEKIRYFNTENNLSEMTKYIMNNCKVITKLEDIPQHIQFTFTKTNRMAKCFANYYHKNKGYYKGLELIYKHTNTYIGDKNKIRFYKNNRYVISGVSHDNIEIYYKLTPNNKITLKKDIVENRFILPYCNTWDSKQGGTCDYPILIDLSEQYLFPDCRKLYTILTRCTQWDNIYLFIDKENIFSKNLDKMILNMIYSHKRTDREKGRLFCETDYVDIKWVYDKLARTTCQFCLESFDTDENSNFCFSIDRIDNSLAHIKDNCRILHRWCNCVKR